MKTKLIALSIALAGCTQPCTSNVRSIPPIASYTLEERVETASYARGCTQGVLRYKIERGEIPNEVELKRIINNCIQWANEKHRLATEKENRL